MKYAIVIPDGCADEPLEALGGRTPLQAAHLPNMDRIARLGVVGRANNVPDSLTPASDVATLSLFGYDPLKVYTGRAPLETAAMGIHLGPNDYAIRCNLIHAPDGTMKDFTAGHISSEDGAPLIQALQRELGGKELAGGTIEFHPGVQYRNILVWRGKSNASPFEGLKTQPPHDIPDKPISEHLPHLGGTVLPAGVASPAPAGSTVPPGGAELLIQLMEASKLILADHPVNVKRIANGEKPATQIWLWGQGKAPRIRSFGD